MNEENKIVPDADYEWLMEYEPLPDMQDHSQVLSATPGDPNHPAPIPGLPLGARQILVIEKYQMISSSFRESKNDKTAYSRCEILVTGCASPSSSKKLNHGYIRFVDKADLKFPTYDHARGRIDIFINADFLPVTLAQLDHRKKFLWIGQFGNGHRYANIHSEP